LLPLLAFKGFVPVIGAFEHLLPGFRVDEIKGVRTSELPAATKGFVEIDEVRGDRPLDRGKLILLGSEGSQGIDDRVESHITLLVLQGRNVNRSPGGRHCRLQGHLLLLRFEKGDDGIFDLALSLQHRLAVVLQQLLENRVLQPNVILEPPVLEDVPLKGAEKTAAGGFGGEKVAKVLEAAGGRYAGADRPPYRKL